MHAPTSLSYSVDLQRDSNALRTDSETYNGTLIMDQESSPFASESGFNDHD